ncbi:MAG: hypothetical protein NVS1B4_16990 [Gemmatimonadaceae bacterium]
MTPASFVQRVTGIALFGACMLAPSTAETGTSARVVRTRVESAGVLGGDAVADAEEPAASRRRRPDVGEVQRRLRRGQTGTYIGEILLSRDSALARWPERTKDPLRVWVQPQSRVADWEPVFADRVRTAFAEWSVCGIPVRFAFTSDSARADVHVTWLDHFDEPISGKTKWARDENWWIVDGDIAIAVHHNGGEPLDDSAIHAIALHEVGHLLGLDHTADSTNIMTPRVRARSLTSADRATMRLLYELPPGTIR